ncbi:DNA polymerase III subunit epsilon [Parasphingopyxis lamellibrachiae]|uniref:DNA polymerase III subunit epsilon n=1 Tax=Parasphingopyxis lamellibrachiae TaxID=680125 RepID=A0A3D9FJ19_9SPHN|nr:DNA polymerase III subunit epsilon [Parasphingopyxis lamellibrachiae]RED17101.1 DNA polymerase-3 subunit epsilon [Parasphingopyxis lamellibrachiae]
MREIVFDTETTGLSPKDGDRLVEIGALEMVNRVETGRSFHIYCNPEREMPSEAFAVHGLSDAFLANKPLFSAEVGNFLEFIGDSPLVAHNAQFDFGFINAELDRCGHQFIAMDRMIDTLAIARTKHPGAKHSLDALCSRYGIDRSQRVLHGALLDAQLLAQVYVELTGGRQIGLVLAEEEQAATPADLRTAEARPQPRRPVREPRPHAASAEERARHAAFVSQLTDPLWPAESQ